MAVLWIMDMNQRNCSFPRNALHHDPLLLSRTAPLKFWQRSGGGLWMQYFTLRPIYLSSNNTLLSFYSTLFCWKYNLLKVQFCWKYKAHILYGIPCVPCYFYNLQCYMTMNIRYGTEWNGAIVLGVMVLKRMRFTNVQHGVYGPVHHCEYECWVPVA